MTVADRIIDRLLRWFEASQPLNTDLVCLQDHFVLSDASEHLSHGGELWNFVRVKGELELRNALLEEGRWVVAIPAGMVLPFDLRARTWLNRLLEVRAEDVVGGLTKRGCAPITQQYVREAVLTCFPMLKNRLELWTLPGGHVTEREIRSVLVAATLGTDKRLGHEALHQVLARWLLEGGPQVTVKGLWQEAFREAYPEGGEWLAWAMEQQCLEALITAGALATSSGGRERAPRLPGVSTERSWRLLADEVERALELVRAQAPERIPQLLAEAEGLFIQLRLSTEDASTHRLLKSALDICLHQFAWRAVQGKPVDEVELCKLRRNLHAEHSRPAIELVESLSRLSRFNAALSQLPESLTLDQLIELGAREVPFADGELLAVRRRLELVAADLVTPARQVLEQLRSVRDRLNQAFAQRLAAQWSEVSARQDVRRPLPLHRISRGLIRRLVDDGRRVLLLVLDGCDLASFYSLMEALPAGVGLCRPNLPNGPLRDDLMVTGPLLTGISLVPTVTSHARRALFAGEIPGNEALDEAESVASNASGDKRAWQENPALDGVPHTLLLKGELSRSELKSADEIVLRALSQPSKVVAVVINGIDDALSSKEETPLPQWRWELLGRGLLEVLRAAVEAHWTVLVTSDHGHTPHWDMSRKRHARAKGQRFSLEPLAGAVRFEGPRVPGGPLYLLTELGAWHGTQRRGYHGGAGLEEVLVPIAFLGAVSPGEGRCIKPSWWLSPGEIRLAEPPAAEEPQAQLVEPYGATTGAEAGATSALSDRSPIVEPGGSAESSVASSGRALDAVATERQSHAHSGGLSDALREALKTEAVALQMVELLKEYQVLGVDQLAKRLNIKTFLVRGTFSRVMNLLTQKGIAVPFSVTERDSGLEYRWKIGA